MMAVVGVLLVQSKAHLSLSLGWAEQAQSMPSPMLRPDHLFIDWGAFPPKNWVKFVLECFSKLELFAMGRGISCAPQTNDAITVDRYGGR